MVANLIDRSVPDMFVIRMSVPPTNLPQEFSGRRACRAAGSSLPASPAAFVLNGFPSGPGRATLD
jgi:hypothetical protein